MGVGWVKSDIGGGAVGVSLEDYGLVLPNTEETSKLLITVSASAPDLSQPVTGRKSLAGARRVIKVY